MRHSKLIIGNLKIDESRPERVHYFFATLLSYIPLQKWGIGITLNNCSLELLSKTKNLLKTNYTHFSILENKGEMSYWEAIKIHEPGFYYLTLEEDHFCMLENSKISFEILSAFVNYNADIIRASFNPIEQRSASQINQTCTQSIKTFLMDQYNHDKFSEAYGYRYFIGTNNIIRTSFAERLYSREGTKPHHFELAKYNAEFEHVCGIPNFEIMRPIDDDHGENNYSLLKSPTEKFERCMKEAEKYL